MSDKTLVKDKKTSPLGQMLAEGNFVNIPRVGELVKGTVIDVSNSEIRLDIDGLTTGVVRGREFYDESNEYSDLKVGDEVEATVLELENENGEMELSLRFAGHQKAWGGLRQLMETSQVVDVAITDANKGGLMIKLGKVSGFLPVSQLTPEHYPRVPGGDRNKILDRLKSFIGTSFEVKVIDVDDREDKLIVSEKAAWEEKQRDVLAQYKPGTVVEGKVTAITDFGVFVEFGDKLEGLIHISELAWQRIDDPHNFVTVGQDVKAEIINIEGSKIFLSIKKLLDDPWKHVNEKYTLNQVVKGKVLKINPFGLFVELDPDIHGLAHISELDDKPVTDPHKIAKEGDVVEFKILSIEPEKHRLGLSIKALKANTNRPASPERQRGEQPAPASAPQPETGAETLAEEKQQ